MGKRGTSSLLYGAEPPRADKVREEPGRFLLDFEKYEGRGNGELVVFRATELEFLGCLLDKRDTFVSVAEACQIFGLASTPDNPGLRSAINIVRLKLNLIAEPSPLRIYVDGYGWDSEALADVRGRD